uniref:Uncharacterized protein n=1 Tax=Oryza sativa subsp. japonica TaxID=39947 RepID=Q6ZAF6_ORYSJ|nr:hypothetical protein [Oryza sativa Japonica Group]
MPPGAGQMWLDVAGRQRLIPERRRGEIRQTRKGEIQRPLQPPRQAVHTGQGRFLHAIRQVHRQAEQGAEARRERRRDRGCQIRPLQHRIRLLQGLAASSKGKLGDARSRSGETGSGSSSITEQPPPRASRLLHPQAAAATVSTSSCGHYVSMPPPSCIRWVLMCLSPLTDLQPSQVRLSHQ